MNRDLIIVIISFFIISSSSFFLYLDYTLRVEKGDAIKIGTIQFKKNVAERKYSGQVIWEDVSRNSPLFNNDSIRTARGSLTIIKLKNGTTIELDEETLILLNITDKGTSIDFSQGSISAKNASVRKKLQITSHGAKVSLDEGKVNLTKKDDASLNVNVSSGKAFVKTDDGIQSVSSDEVAVITKSSAKIREKTLFLNKPVENKIFITQKLRKLISFSWKSKKKEYVFIQFARTRNFAKIAKQYKSLQSFNTALPAGTYYWRILRKGYSKEISNVRKFTILKDKSAEPIFPAQNKNFIFIKAKPLISFAWLGSSLASSYILEIASDRKMNNIIKKTESRNNRISIDDLNEGNYFWRIKSRYPFIGTPLMSNNKIFQFSVSKKRTITKPILLAPKNNERISSINMAANTLLFNWSKNTEVYNYTFVVSSEKEFNKVVFNGSTSFNYFLLKKSLQPGVYFWKVKGIVDTLQSDSPTHRFVITAPKPILLRAPKNKEMLIFLKEGTHSFQWEDPNNGKKYRIELSRNKMFAPLYKKVISVHKSATMRISESGTFFWRVLLVDDNSKILQRSGTYVFQIRSNLMKPIALSPINNATLDMTYRNRILFSWKRVAGASHYKFQLFQFRPGGKKKIFEKKVPHTKIVFNNLTLLNKGNFFWEIQALKFSGAKVVSRSSSKKYYFSILLKEPTKKPEIITPEVIYVQ